MPWPRSETDLRGRRAPTERPGYGACGNFKMGSTHQTTCKLLTPSAIKYSLHRGYRSGSGVGAGRARKQPKSSVHEIVSAQFHEFSDVGTRVRSVLSLPKYRGSLKLNPKSHLILHGRICCDRALHRLQSFVCQKH